jgi:hypothetical protein
MLFSKLDANDPLDASVRSCLAVSFFTLVRGGEFTVPSLNSFDPEIHIKRSDVSTTTDRHNLPVTVFRIPHTKCSKDGEDVYCAAQPEPINPISELDNHLSINNPPANSHLFAYRHTGGHRPLTKHTFLGRLNAIASSLGLDPLKGHGVRIGGTLEYLLRGVPFDVVKSMGRWTSDAFTLYLRKHAVIMAPYLQASPILESFTHYTMPPVRSR